MDVIEARTKARESTVPSELSDIYDQFHNNADVVKAIVNNPFCPDEIKKKYVIHALNDIFPTYNLGPSGPDVIAAVEKSLEAWRPVRKVAPVPDLDESDEMVMQLYDVVQRKKAIILYGPPGTSKTYLSRMIANALTEGIDHRTGFVQFHASYTYEDFIEGIIPRPVDNGIVYEVEDKVFKKFCKKANEQSNNIFVFIIDEINRADLSKVFGEVFTCLEYREQSVNLLYSRDLFFIPENVIVIGTMNTIDRSTVDLDFALRRRFFFFEIPPREKWLDQILDKNNVDEELKESIIEAFVQTQQIYPLGHAYFKDVETIEDVEILWKHQLHPLLDQYFEFNSGNVNRIKHFFSSIWSVIGDEE